MDSDAAMTARDPEMPPYAQEALLIGAIAEMAAAEPPARRVICTSAGLAQFAGAAAAAMPQAVVQCAYLDQYRANRAIVYWQDRPNNAQIECAADLVGENADVVAMPFSMGGEAELTRDLIQSGHERLRMDGKLYASTDNAADTWLGEQLR